jgi:hypothetical protein
VDGRRGGPPSFGTDARSAHHFLPSGEWSNAPGRSLASRACGSPSKRTNFIKKLANGERLANPASCGVGIGGLADPLLVSMPGLGKKSNHGVLGAKLISAAGVDRK